MGSNLNPSTEFQKEARQTTSRNEQRRAARNNSSYAV